LTGVVGEQHADLDFGNGTRLSRPSEDRVSRFAGIASPLRLLSHPVAKIPGPTRFDFAQPATADEIPRQSLKKEIVKALVGMSRRLGIPQPSNGIPQRIILGAPAEKLGQALVTAAHRPKERFSILSAR
jgi:hypothetical protein